MNRCSRSEATNSPRNEEYNQPHPVMSNTHQQRTRSHKNCERGVFYDHKTFESRSSIFQGYNLNALPSVNKFAIRRAISGVHVSYKLRDINTISWRRGTCILYIYTCIEKERICNEFQFHIAFIKLELNELQIIFIKYFTRTIFI